MKKYKMEVTATVWNEPGDHEEVYSRGDKRLGASWSFDECQHCKKPSTEHGFMFSTEGGILVCPGDYIVDNGHGLIRRDPARFKREYTEVV
jgi:hypothetical protein